MVKKEETTLPVAWDEELAREAEAAAAAERGSQGGNFLSLKSGVLSYQGNPVLRNELDIVILDYVFENNYYSDSYDADNPRPPACYALAKIEADLKPDHEVSAAQHTQCKGCPQNEFGTADKGRGKACKNSRRLALITSEGLTDAINADVAMLKLPPTSIKQWSGYLQLLAGVAKRPVWGVVTKLKVVPDTKTQFKVTWQMVRPLTVEELAAVKEKRVCVQSMLVAGYPKPSDKIDEPLNKGKKRKF